MMTPEQEQDLRRLYAVNTFTDVCGFVKYLLAAERAAERERDVAIIDASCVINQAQAVALIAAIRAQEKGGGNG